ncbi:MAG: AAA family ATPase [Acidimicrobiales bacterium]
MVEAIGGYVRMADTEGLSARLGASTAVLAQMIPELRSALPATSPPPPLPPNEERFRLLDAVARFLSTIADDAPVVLVLDDLHWADRGTLELLRHIARLNTRSWAPTGTRTPTVAATCSPPSSSPCCAGKPTMPGSASGGSPPPRRASTSPWPREEHRRRT